MMVQLTMRQEHLFSHTSSITTFSNLTAFSHTHNGCNLTFSLFTSAMPNIPILTRVGLGSTERGLGRLLSASVYRRGDLVKCW